MSVSFSAMASEPQKYCDLEEFAKSYRNIHGYLSVLVCIFGSVANILNICVLTTKEMRWPTNFILTGIAVADLFVMLVYIPFASHQYLNSKPKLHADNYTYSWVAFLNFQASFSLLFHFISCCLTVLLAVWRYIAISRPQNNRLWHIVINVRSTLFAIFSVYIICTIICIPVYISHKVKSNRRYVDNNNILLNKTYNGSSFNKTVYTLEISGYFAVVTFWVYTILKLVPCILLTILTINLISSLLDTKKRRRALINNSGVPLKEQTALKQRRQIEKEQQTDRTTRMLVAVLLLFLITELPQAVLGLFCIIIGHDFLKQCYLPLGEVLDILALVNSAINFILYCSMSRQFRSAFGELFRPKLLNRWLPLPTHIEMNGGMTQVTQV